jgi:putative sterol carrier protein
MLGQSKREDDTPYIKELQAHFVPQEDFSANYSFAIDGCRKPLFISVTGSDLVIHYGQEEDVDVYAKISAENMQAIVDGRMTFQRAFMTGEMTAKGNFKTLRTLDQIFRFD